MAIPQLINIPTTADPVNFAPKADNLLNVQLPAVITEMNNVSQAMNLNATNATSTTSNTIGTGAKTFTTQTGKSYVGGMYVTISDSSAPSTNAFYGTVTSYNSGTGALVINAETSKGSGTLSSWVIAQTAPGGATSATVAATIQNQSATAFTSTGTSPTFAVVTSPVYSALAANQRIRVKFNAAVASGASTLNRDATGAIGLKQYDSTGTKIDAVIAANQLADIEYDGTHYVILDPLPAVIFKNINFQALITSGNFTTTSNITTSTLFKITLVGAGAGGGGTNGASAMGGGGGAGGAFSFYISGLTASTNYAVVIGAAGAGGSTAGGNGGTGGATTIVINGLTYTASGGVAGAGTTTASASRTAAQGAINAQSAPSIPIYQANGEAGKSNGTVSVGAGGASLPFGTGGPGGLSGIGATGIAAVGYGAGGGGAIGATAAGGAGAPGLFFAEWVA